MVFCLDEVCILLSNDWLISWKMRFKRHGVLSTHIYHLPCLLTLLLLSWLLLSRSIQQSISNCNSIVFIITAVHKGICAHYKLLPQMFHSWELCFYYLLVFKILLSNRHFQRLTSHSIPGAPSAPAQDRQGSSTVHPQALYWAHIQEFPLRISCS